MRTARVLALALACSACSEERGPVKAPVFGAPAEAAPVPTDLPVLPPPLVKAPLPAAPKDEGERLRGLLRLLEEGDPRLVEFAGATLADFPDPAAAGAALAAAGAENLRKNSGYVMNILSSVRDGRVGASMAPFLLRCVDSEDPQIRRMAVMEYAQSVDRPDLAVLARASTAVFAPAAQSAFAALELHRGPAAAAALREVMGRLSPSARPAAANTLGRLGDRESIPLLRALLAEARAGGEMEVSLRIGAAQGLARLGEEEGLAELRSFVLALPRGQPAVPLDFPPEQWEGPEAVLAEAGDTLLKGRLLLQARTARSEAASAAVRMLAVRYPGDGEAAAATAAALDRADGDFLLAAEALDALHGANPAAGKARAEAFLESPVEERRYGAALALGRWKDPATVPALAARVKGDPAVSVRRKCCDALGLIGDPAGAPALVEFLAKEKEATPDRALEAMTARGNLRGALADAAAEDLVALVSGKGSAAVRFNAALALGQARKSPKARPALEGLLADPLPSLRTAAAEGLGLLGDPAARGALAAAHAVETDGDAAASQRDAVLRLSLGEPVNLRALLLALPLLAGPAVPEDPWAAAAKAVQRAAGEKDPAPLADALYALREFDGEPAARLVLGTAIRREVPDFVLDGAMDAMASWTGPESAAVFVKELERTRDGKRFPLLEALGRLGHASAEEALVAAAEDRDPRFRAAAVRALADRKSPSTAARGAAGAACLDADPRVRSAGIAALAGWKGLPAALPLLGRLEVEKGRLFGDAWRGLRRISGRDLPPSPDAWAEWWRTQPDEGEWRYDSVPAAPRPSIAAPGIHSFTRRVVFVLDISEGMADKPGYRGEDLVPEDQRADPAILAEWKGMKTRLDHARCHLARMIRGLPEDAAFDVVFGAETAGAVFRSCQPATAENRDRALGRLKGLAGKERQDFLRLVRTAWSGSAEADPLSAEAFAGGPDTVVYLGTALPSWGAELDAGRIASSVRRWNRVRQVQFFGIGVGSHGSGLLSDLASMSPVGGSAGID